MQEHSDQKALEIADEFAQKLNLRKESIELLTNLINSRSKDVNELWEKAKKFKLSKEEENRLIEFTEFFSEGYKIHKDAERLYEEAKQKVLKLSSGTKNKNRAYMGNLSQIQLAKKIGCTTKTLRQRIKKGIWNWCIVPDEKHGKNRLKILSSALPGLKRELIPEKSERNN